jgi:hypothetical protein
MFASTETYRVLAIKDLHAGSLFGLQDKVGS